MRIRLYPINQNLTNSDTLLGTDSGGLTKNFQLGTLAQFFTSGLSVSGTTVVTSGADSIGLSATLNVENGISASSNQLSANPTIGLTSVVVSGVGSKITFDSFGRVVSAGSLQESDIPNISASKVITNSTNRFVTDSQISDWSSPLTSADIPSLPTTKIIENSNSRFVSDIQMAYWNSLSAGVVVSATSASQLEFDAMLLAESQKNKFVLVSASSPITSALPSDLSRSKQLSLLYSGRREKRFAINGPTSGTYSATVTFYGTDIDRSDWVYPDNCVIASIDNNTNSVEAFFENNLIVWSASLDISGTPNGVITAEVEA